MSNSSPPENSPLFWPPSGTNREARSKLEEDIAALEASLLADIESFDLDAAERRARRDNFPLPSSGKASPALAFPTICDARPSQTLHGTRDQDHSGPELTSALDSKSGSVLSELRRQAEQRQQDVQHAIAERSAVNESVDQRLKYLFYYLHDFVRQLNIIKPAISRPYPLLEGYALSQLAWQEGFADYRSQSLGANALVEQVTFSYRLAGGNPLILVREGTSVDRLRTRLFDFGLVFNCKEFRNERHYIERCEFEVKNEISVTVRWRADFDQGRIVLESRNLERPGSTTMLIHPLAIDLALLEEFARLVLDRPSQFRRLARRS